MFQNRFLYYFSKFYQRVIDIGSNLQSLFLLWMRLTWGHQFFLTGVGKLANIEKTTEFFTTLGLAYPEATAYFIGVLELVGGICLFFGFASRLIAIPLIIAMVTALSLAHTAVFSHFQFLLHPSTLVHQAPYPFLITSLLIFIFGPGKISLDAWIKRWLEKQPKY